MEKYMNSKLTIAEANLLLNEISAEDLDWFEELPREFPDCGQERDYSHARQITISGVVKGTERNNRTTQEGVLKEQSLVFSDPRDQTIAAAIHACKHNGEDLFKDFWVRGSVPGFALLTRRYNGVDVSRCDDGAATAASGSPSPELK